MRYSIKSIRYNFKFMIFNNKPSECLRATERYKNLPLPFP